MKTHIFFCILIVALTISGVGQTIDDEKDAIRKVIQVAYVDGLQNEGNIAKIDSGIHPEFNLLGVSEKGQLWRLSIQEWKSNVLKKKAEGKLPREGNDLVSIKFLHIDITGNAAMVKIEFYVGDILTFVDYISLYKFGEDWKMVNKIFYKF